MTTRYYGPANVREFLRTELTEIAWDDQQVGETVATYDLVYRDGDFWRLTSARQPSTAPDGGIGMVQLGVNSGRVTDIWMRGILSNGSWGMVSGALLFLGSSNGSIVMSSPTPSGSIVLLIGRALTQTAIEFNPTRRQLIAT